MAEETKPAEKRHKLKPKQWEAIVNSTMRINQATEHLELQKQRAKVESDLIMEALGLDPEAQVQLDPKSQELIELVAPEAPEAEKTKRARKPKE